jgi:hypothetical protein
MSEARYTRSYFTKQDEVVVSWEETVKLGSNVTQQQQASNTLDYGGQPMHFITPAA